jgi:hypothetical protein
LLPSSLASFLTCYILTSTPTISPFRLISHLPPQLGQLPLELKPLLEQLAAPRLQRIDALGGGCFGELPLLLFLDC